MLTLPLPAPPAKGRRLLKVSRKKILSTGTMDHHLQSRFLASDRGCFISPGVGTNADNQSPPKTQVPRDARAHIDSSPVVQWKPSGPAVESRPVSLQSDSWLRKLLN